MVISKTKAHTESFDSYYACTLYVQSKNTKFLKQNLVFKNKHTMKVVKISFGMKIKYI